MGGCGRRTKGLRMRRNNEMRLMGRKSGRLGRSETKCAGVIRIVIAYSNMN